MPPDSNYYDTWQATVSKQTNHCAQNQYELHQLSIPVWCMRCHQLHERKKNKHKINSHISVKTKVYSSNMHKEKNITILYVLMCTKSEDVIPEHSTQWARLISDSMALSQALAEASWPWTRGQQVTQCACLNPSLLPSICWYQIILLGDSSKCVWTTCRI